MENRLPSRDFDAATLDAASYADAVADAVNGANLFKLSQPCKKS
jgi:hypothetical protein